MMSPTTSVCSIRRGTMALFATVVLLGLSDRPCRAQCPREEQERLIPATLGPGANLGAASIWGEVAAIGAPGVGSVHLYRFDGRRWQEEHVLSPSDPGQVPGFGHAVALEGDRLVVGNPHVFADGGTFLGPSVGGVLVFEWNGTQWIETQLLLASDFSTENSFGYSVALDGDRLVVGTRMANTQTGRVYVFERAGGSWMETARILDPLGEPGLFKSFGRAVDLEADRILIGSPGHRLVGTREGSAYLYRRSGTRWNFEKRLFALDFHDDQAFGRSVCLSGLELVVGAAGDSDGGARAGAAYFFRYDAARQDWQQSQKVRQGDTDDLFGTAVSLDGDRAAVGAPGADWQGAEVGTAYLYHREGGAWVPGLRLVPGDGGQDGDHFGSHVEVHGDDSFVGASQADLAATDAGAVFSCRVRELSFDVRPDELSAGDIASFEVCKGQPNGLVLPVLEEWDGQRVNLRFAAERFDAQGRWSRSLSVPPGLQGIEAVFVCYGFSSTSPKVVASWPEILRFVP